MVMKFTSCCKDSELCTNKMSHLCCRKTMVLCYIDNHNWGQKSGKMGGKLCKGYTGHGKRPKKPDGDAFTFLIITITDLNYLSRTKAL